METLKGSFEGLRRLLLTASLSLVGLAQPLALGSGDSLQSRLSQIHLPPGFKIEVFAKDVRQARALALSPSGTLFVASSDAGKIYAIREGKTYTIASGLENPIGVTYRDGTVYFSAVSKILKIDGIEQKLSNPPEPTVVVSNLPKESHHGGRYMRFGPDGLLYLGVGAPCNVCLRPDDERFASIVRMKPDGSSAEVFAHGVRNTVGFDWHPSTKELWFTDNGRDLLGDNAPPDELNRAPRAGMNFGFPYCHGKSILDPEFGPKLKQQGKSCKDFTPPERELGPHVASLGMRFYTGKMFPEEYRGNVFIAEHGSWNRSTPIGYRITRVRLTGKGAPTYETFAEGWLQKDGVLGRPVDVEVMPDGSLLVSDDRADAIYRIRYSKP